MESSKPTFDNIMEFYTNVLTSVGLDVSSEGLVSMDVGGVKIPSEIDSKRLVLPTQTILRNGDWSDKIAFHPMSENVYRGESTVLKKLRTMVNYRLKTVLNDLIIQLITIAAEKDKHQLLSPKQNGILSLIPKVDDATVSAFGKIVSNTSVNKNRVVSVYLKRGGKLKGNDFSRVAVVSFPITEEFENEDKTIFGTKLRVKDFKAFTDLFEYIVPDCEGYETYSYGSNSMVAPYFHSLMKAYVNIAKQLNKITKLFKKHLDDADKLLINVDWESQLDDLSFYKDLIPNLDGNDGELSIEDKKNQAAEKENGFGVSSWTDNLKQTDTNTQTNSTKISDMLKQVEQTQQPTNTRSEQAPSGNGRSWDDIVNKKTGGNPNMAPAAPPGFAGEQYNPFQPQQQNFGSPHFNGMNQNTRFGGRSQNPMNSWGGNSTVYGTGI